MNDDFTDILRDLDDPASATAEVVIDAKTGRPRQAGAAQDDGAWIVGFRERAERSLYFFAKAILGLTRLTEGLHRDDCYWLTTLPPFRKLWLLPRDHLKTSIASRSIPLHILVQPKTSNLYIPNKQGASVRILLAGETEKNAQNQLGWMSARLVTNPFIRAFWPHIVWENPRTQARVWNQSAIVVPREEDYPEGSIEVIGVGGAVTGRHYDVQVKDDLTTLQAANSPTVMQTAIEWHETSRALFDDPNRGLEFITGTRWAIWDLYSHIIKNDPTVEWRRRAVVQDGKPLVPVWGDGTPAFSLKVIDELKRRHGVLFPLLYMNEASDPSLTDFNMAYVREYRWDGPLLTFTEDHRDAVLAERLNAPAPSAPSVERGTPLTPATYDHIFGRDEFFKYGRVRSA